MGVRFVQKQDSDSRDVRQQEQRLLQAPARIETVEPRAVLAVAHHDLAARSAM